MTTPKLPALAYRHECISKDAVSWQSGFHTKRDGKPRSARCTYCRGELRIEQGYHGVFIHNWENRYPLAGAVKLFTSPAAAQRYVDTHGDADSPLVVRWVSA